VKTKVSRIVAATLLLFVLIRPTPTSAHAIDGSTTYHYSSSCLSSVFGVDYQVTGHAYHRPANPSSIFGTSSIVTIEDLRACTAPQGLSDSGFSMVFGANIEGWRTGFVNGDFGHIQLGYGITDCPSAPCGNGLPDDQLKFLYTSDDTSPGYFRVAAWAPTPIVGREYRLRITATTVSGAWKWKLAIKDLTYGVEYTTYIVRTWFNGVPGTPGGGYRAWAGAEIINAASQINRAGGTVHYIYNLRDQTSYGGAWTNFPNNGCNWAVQSDPYGVGPPSSSWAGCTHS